MEAERVKAHRTEKDKKEMSHFKKFVTQGNEKADDLAKECTLLDEKFMAQTRAKTIKQEREEVAAMHCAASFHCLKELEPQPKERWAFVERQDRDKASNGVVCRCQQVPMSEMWKKQQECENTTEMHKAKVLVNKIFGKW